MDTDNELALLTEKDGTPWDASMWSIIPARPVHDDSFDLEGFRL